LPENCGFICKSKKGISSIKSQIATAQTKNRTKKANKYGYSSYFDYTQAVNKAREKGQKKAEGELRKGLLKDAEKREYLIKGGKKGKQKSMLDSILGEFKDPAKPKRKRKTPTKGTWVIVGGKAYPKATNRTKKRKSSKKKSDDWLGDLGLNF
jgi:hypothetical protein